MNWLLVGAGFLCLTAIGALLVFGRSVDPTDQGDEDLDGPPGDA